MPAQAPSLTDAASKPELLEEIERHCASNSELLEVIERLRRRAQELQEPLADACLPIHPPPQVDAADEEAAMRADHT